MQTVSIMKVIIITQIQTKQTPHCYPLEYHHELKQEQKQESRAVARKPRDAAAILMIQKSSDRVATK